MNFAKEQTSIQSKEKFPLSCPLCVHCGNPVPKFSSSEFCCLGCKRVYQWIQGHQLEKYYDLKNKTRAFRKLNRVGSATGAQENFHYLDEPQFLKLYSWETSEGRWMNFYLQGVHCAACIWLTEKVADLVDHVSLVRLNLGSSVATVQIDAQGSFSAVASALQSMGYPPHPVQPGESGELQKRENRVFLARIGVAGAMAGNIMLLAVSLYAGATGAMAEEFRWISGLLFLPVLLFSATPFYQSAWSAIRAREISIDIPVVFGLLVGSVGSWIHLLSGNDHVYFDSLSALIFLLLSTRYGLKKAQQIALDSSKVLHFRMPSRVKKWNANSQMDEQVSLDQVQVGDRVRVAPSECIPVDGVVLHGVSSLDCSFLSGESEAQKVGVGDLVFAGTLNLDSPLDLEVTQSGSKTRLGRILGSLETLVTQKAPIALFADRVSRYFVVAVMIASVIALARGAYTGWQSGLNSALALAIVTCPCTFALITPLAFTLTLGKLARAGILVRGAEVLEKLTQIQSVFLDKTGTLTAGAPQVKHWEVPEELWGSVLAIESHSVHPIAKALVLYLSSRVSSVLPDLQEIKETPSVGIQAKVRGSLIEIRQAEKSTEGTELSVFKDQICVGRIVLMDTVRPESKEAVELLQSLSLKLSILSGDHRVPVLQVAQSVGIHAENCFFEFSPEQKSEIIQKQNPVLMVGDGANDALALARAFVGIAVHSGVEMSLQVADVYLSIPGVRPVYSLIVIAQETLRVVRRNLVFSIFYNIIAGGFALRGEVTPLMAAILMPMSALTVFLSSITGTSRMKNAFQRIQSL